uniref:Uncharacterized protein n=1 Tax=Oryza meridionalis TaxID=40149 RepID=A0A0E0CSR9_9ORYZ
MVCVLPCMGMLGLERNKKGKKKSLQSDRKTTLGFVSLGSMAAEKTKQRRGIEESARMRMRDKGRLSDETPSEEGHEIIRFRRGW